MHWKVSFTRRGMEPPAPFGRQSHVVCADTRDAAKALVPASPYHKVTASAVDAPVTFTYVCRCKATP